MLAAFAQCENEHDLAAVRDGFRLCMASQLCPKEIESVTKVVKAVGAQDTLLSTTNAARKCNEWWVGTYACNNSMDPWLTRGRTLPFKVG